MRVFRWSAIGVFAVLIGAGVAVGIGSIRTERDIRAFQAQIEQKAQTTPATAIADLDLTALPAPVQRYFAFVFPNGGSEARLVRLTAEGQFRRPRKEDFNFTTAEQVIALSEPALMFSATTPVSPGIWARAYDYFADGKMEMKAKVLSTLTVVDERETPDLNIISLRRWLLESALYPHALLPGGPVIWEAIDDYSARAIVVADGLQSSMIARFDIEGRLTDMVAEEDGDLNTPYHGSGEHVARSDYKEVDGVMIPHAFVISRKAGGATYPFFDGKLTSISFE